MRTFKSLEKPLVLLFLLCLFPLGALAQSVVKGTVKDEVGEPVIAAAIRVIGTQTGCVTDVNGQFSIETQRNAQLEVSCIGYVTQRVNVQGRQNIIITLVEDNTERRGGHRLRYTAP